MFVWRFLSDVDLGKEMEDRRQHPRGLRMELGVGIRIRMRICGSYADDFHRGINP